MRIVFAIAIALLSFQPIALASTVKGTVEWKTASTLGVVKIKGVGASFTGTVSQSGKMASGIFECDLGAFDTGVEERNDHMLNKYLEVKKFPKATLELDPVEASADFQWTGKLTVKGETKPVKGHGSLKGDQLAADFSIALTDYPAIGVPAWKGVTVAKDVAISIAAKVSP